MSDITMRAKFRVANVQPSVDAGGNTTCETLTFSAVHKCDGYPPDGSDENNSFARWTPSATLEMQVNNPALFGKFGIGQEFYADFTPAQ